MVLNINGLTLSLGEGVDLLPARAASLLGLSEGVVTDLRVLRRSIDARRARPPRFVYLVSVRLPDGVTWRPGEHAIGVSVTVETKVPEERPAGPSGGAPATEQRPVVAG
ncbi:MAG: hypothetical protein AABZ85_01825, partial [Thermodesulfobacteriota bacterium]